MHGTIIYTTISYQLAEMINIILMCATMLNKAVAIDALTGVCNVATFVEALAIGTRSWLVSMLSTLGMTRSLTSSVIGVVVMVNVVLTRTANRVAPDIGVSADVDANMWTSVVKFLEVMVSPVLLK